MRALMLAVALGLALPFAGSRAADDVTIEATRREDALQVVCRATLAAPRSSSGKRSRTTGTWRISSRACADSQVLSRNGAVSVVEQSGEARFLFLSVPIEVTLASHRAPART